MVVKGPSLRAARIDFTALDPTPRTAPRPKRIWVSPTAVNFHPDSFKSGGRTSTPSCS